MNGVPVTDSDIVSEDDIVDAELVDDALDDGISPPISLPSSDLSDGSTVDAALSGQEDTGRSGTHARPDKGRGRLRSATEDKGSSGARDAKAGPPTLDEWTRFFSRVLLRVITEYYISYAFRDVDEDLLSDREIERIAMTDDERQMIAVPFAELSNKSKFMRKHGRMIVASGDAFNSLVVFGVWMARVNRIASKYRPRQPQNRQQSNDSFGQGTAPSNGSPNGALGGRLPPGFTGFIRPGSG